MARAAAAKWMQLALIEAHRGMTKQAGGPFGAVIVKGNSFIASAYNTVLKDHDATCHAEINAISKACRKLKQHHLKGTVIYTTTEPCPMCFSAIHWARITKIVCGTAIRDVAKLGFNEVSISNQRLKTLGKLSITLRSGFMRKEALELLDEWNASAEHTTY